MFWGQAEDALTFFRDKKIAHGLAGCARELKSSLEPVSLMAAPSGAAKQSECLSFLKAVRPQGAMQEHAGVCRSLLVGVTRPLAT